MKSFSVDPRNCASITESQFEVYEEVRREGLVNMHDVEQVAEWAGLTVAEAKSIHRNYAAMRDVFNGEDG